MLDDPRAYRGVQPIDLAPTPVIEGGLRRLARSSILIEVEEALPDRGRSAETRRALFLAFRAEADALLAELDGDPPPATAAQHPPEAANDPTDPHGDRAWLSARRGPRSR